MRRIDVNSLAVARPKNFGELAGLISSNATTAVVMDTAGDGIMLDIGSLRKDQYQTLKTEHRVICAVGLRANENLLVWNHKAQHLHTEPQHTRPNSGGWKLLPKYRSGATHLASVSANASNTVVLRRNVIQFGIPTKPDHNAVARYPYVAEYTDGTKQICDNVKQTKLTNVTKLWSIE